MNLLDKLEDLIKNLRFEMSRIHGLKNQYSQEILGIVVNIDGSTIEEVEQIQLKYGIKKKENGVVSWNNEYKEENLNETYIQVLDNVIGNIQLLIPELKHQFATKNQNQINKILQKKLKSLNKNINSHEGYLFFDDDYRCRKNNLLKNRFDAIWKINELYLIFPLSKRKEGTFVIASAEYPFISFNLQQWYDFELSFHLIPLFKEAVIEVSKNYDACLYDFSSSEKQRVYDKYKHVFKQFSAFSFTYETINNFKENVSSQIESLYEALEKNRLIKNQKANFKAYLLDVHDITQPKIRDYHNLINDKHAERVRFFQNELKDFTKNS